MRSRTVFITGATGYLVTRLQMLRALVRAVEDASPGISVVDVPGIRTAM